MIKLGATQYLAKPADVGLRQHPAGHLDVTDVVIEDEMTPAGVGGSPRVGTHPAGEAMMAITDTRPRPSDHRRTLQRKPGQAPRQGMKPA